MYRVCLQKGNTALHISSLAGHEAVVEALVRHGAKVNAQSQVSSSRSNERPHIISVELYALIVSILAVIVESFRIYFARSLERVFLLLRIICACSYNHICIY